MDTSGNPDTAAGGSAEDSMARALFEAVTSLGQTAQTTTVIQQQQSHALDVIAQRLEHQNQTPRPTAPKVREPRQFSGKASEVLPFLRELRAAVHLQRNALPSEYDKSVYLSMYLKDGSPVQWFYGLERTRPIVLNDFETLLEEFKTRFQDTDIVMTYLRKIESLTQTGSAASYANQFQEYLNYVDMNDHLQIKQFDRGLKEDLLRVLINVARPATLDLWIPQVVEADNRLHTFELQRKQRGSRNTSTRSTSSTDRRPSSTATSTAVLTPSGNNDVVPMEVDVVRHGRVSSEEKARRRREGLCFYCGQGRHIISDCPNMSEESKRNRKAHSASAGKA